MTVHSCNPRQAAPQFRTQALGLNAWVQIPGLLQTGHETEGTHPPWKVERIAWAGAQVVETMMASLTGSPC
jgi:hypothetical protein